MIVHQYSFDRNRHYKGSLNFGGPEVARKYTAGKVVLRTQRQPQDIYRLRQTKHEGISMSPQSHSSTVSPWRARSFLRSWNSLRKSLKFLRFMQPEDGVRVRRCRQKCTADIKYTPSYIFYLRPLLLLLLLLFAFCSQFPCPSELSLPFRY